MQKRIRKVLIFSFLRIILGDPFGIRNLKCFEIIMKRFAL